MAANALRVELDHDGLSASTISVASPIFISLITTLAAHVFQPQPPWGAASAKILRMLNAP